MHFLFVSAMSGEADSIGDVVSTLNGTGGEFSFPDRYFLNNNLTGLYANIRPSLHCVLMYTYTTSCPSVSKVLER